MVSYIGECYIHVTPSEPLAPDKPPPSIIILLYVHINMADLLSQANIGDWNFIEKYDEFINIITSLLLINTGTSVNL